MNKNSSIALIITIAAVLLNYAALKMGWTDFNAFRILQAVILLIGLTAIWLLSYPRLKKSGK